MHSGISPVMATVLLVAIAVIASVSVWFWVAPFTEKSAMPRELVGNYIVVNAYQNLQSGGCDSIDIKNIGAFALRGVAISVRNYSTGMQAQYASESIYVNITELGPGETGHFNLSSLSDPATPLAVPSGTYLLRKYSGSIDIPDRIITCISITEPAIALSSWLDISSQNPASLSSQSLPKYSLLNVTLSAICNAVSCATVNATIRYNTSSGLNPDTAPTASMLAPFFILPNETNLDWTQVANTTSKFSTRDCHGAYALNDSIWVIGGYTGSVGLNDVWRSADGASWTQVTNTTPKFSARFHFGAAVLNNSMWLLGGYDSTPTRYNDVWRSADGANWTQITNSTPKFSTRWEHGAYSFNGSLWIVGGNNDTSFLNDVWKSSDGANWTQIANVTPKFSNRGIFGAYIFNNYIWLIGGYDNVPTRYNDVWKSSDGANWTQITNTTPKFTTRSQPGAYVYDGSMWVVGGYSGTVWYNDVWKSSDGANWTQVTNTTSKFSGMTGFGASLSNSSVWAVGGYNGVSRLNTVWRSLGATNPRSCGAMSAGNNCIVNWRINVTAVGQYWLDTNFTSTNGNNTDSGDFQITVT